MIKKSGQHQLTAQIYYIQTFESPPAPLYQRGGTLQPPPLEKGGLRGIFYARVKYPFLLD